MNVQARIQQLMQGQGLTKYGLSRISTVPPSTINNIFLGTSPTVYTLEQICDAFGITLSQFFTDPEKETLYPLTEEQKLLVEKWGKLSKEQKKALIGCRKQLEEEE